MLTHLHRAQWELGRQDESIETLDRALALLDACRGHRRARRAAGAQVARPHAPEPQPRGDRAGREALEVARSVGRPQRGDPGADLDRRGARRRARGGRGDRDAARGAGSGARSTALLDHVGRSTRIWPTCSTSRGEARRRWRSPARDSRRCSAGGRSGTWVGAARRRDRVGAGRLASGRGGLMPRERRRYWGSTLLNYRVRRIEQALGRGDVAGAAWTSTWPSASRPTRPSRSSSRPRGAPGRARAAGGRRDGRPARRRRRARPD